MVWQIECDTGCSYTQESERKLHPTVCGACGSRAIRVWQLIYDARTAVIKERIAQRLADEVSSRKSKCEVLGDRNLYREDHNEKR